MRFRYVKSVSFSFEIRIAHLHGICRDAFTHTQSNDLIQTFSTIKFKKIELFFYSEKLNQHLLFL